SVNGSGSTQDEGVLVRWPETELFLMKDRAAGSNRVATDRDCRLGRVDHHVAPGVVASPNASGHPLLGAGGGAEIGRGATVPDVSSIRPGHEHDRALAVPVQQVRAAQEATLRVLATLRDVVGRPELEPLRLRIGFEALPLIPMLVPSVLPGKSDRMRDPATM